MDGTAELNQLAHLLRVGASTAREIAKVRNVNEIEINLLADRADAMAEDLERIAATPLPVPVQRVAQAGRQ